MFDMQYDARERVTWCTVRGVVTEGTLVDLDAVGAVLLDAEGAQDCVFDFLAVEAVLISRETIARRGQVPRARDVVRRVFIATHPDVLAMARLFSAHQAEIGSPPPDIVATAEEARAALGKPVLNLRKVEIGWLRETLRQTRSEPIPGHDR